MKLGAVSFPKLIYQLPSVFSWLYLNKGLTTWLVQYICFFVLLFYQNETICSLHPLNFILIFVRTLYFIIILFLFLTSHHTILSPNTHPLPSSPQAPFSAHHFHHGTHGLLQNLSLHVRFLRHFFLSVFIRMFIVSCT